MFKDVATVFVLGSLGVFKKMLPENIFRATILESSHSTPRNAVLFSIFHFILKTTFPTISFERFHKMLKNGHFFRFIYSNFININIIQRTGNQNNKQMSHKHKRAVTTTK